MSGPALAQTRDAELSAVNGRFREAALADRRLLSRATFSEIDRPNPMLHYALQPWPTFVGSRLMADMERVSTGLSRLIRGLPERVFANDSVAISRHFDLDPTLVAALLPPPNGIEGAVSRADFVLTDEGIRCIEFNVASSLGGWENGILADMLLRIDPIQEFVREGGVRFVHRSPVRGLLLHCARRAVAAGRAQAGVLNFGIGMRGAAPPQAERMLGAYLGAEYREVLREIEPSLRGNLLLCPYADLTEREGRLWLREAPVQTLLEWHNHGTEPKVFRAFKSGHLDLYNGPASFILADKRCISLLSEHAEAGDVLDEDERDLVLEHVPWTRQVADRAIEYRGERVSMPELIRGHRSRFVIKKAAATSAGGSDVVLGPSASDARWEEVLGDALADGGWLVQELVDSLPLLYQNGPEGCSPHDAIWGPFVFGDTFAGLGLRVQPKEMKDVVNLHRGATVGIVLEVEEE